MRYGGPMPRDLTPVELTQLAYVEAFEDPRPVPSEPPDNPYQELLRRRLIRLGRPG